MPTRDLTHPLDESTAVYPGDPPVRLAPAATHDEDGYRVTDLRLGSHSGTHVDAPSHTEPDGKDVDEFAVDRFAFDARLVDCSGKDAREPIRRDELASKVDDEKANHGEANDEEVGGADLLVVRTGWDAHWGTDRYFDHPYLDREAAAWCADRGLSVGLDALSPDPTPTRGDGEAKAKTTEPDGVPAHRELLGEGRLVVENLCDLGGLPDRFEVRAYPLALSGADGAPVRAVAVW